MEVSGGRMGVCGIMVGWVSRGNLVVGWVCRVSEGRSDVSGYLVVGWLSRVSGVRVVMWDV